MAFIYELGETVVSKVRVDPGRVFAVGVVIARQDDLHEENSYQIDYGNDEDFDWVGESDLRKHDDQIAYSIPPEPTLAAFGLKMYRVDDLSMVCRLMDGVRVPSSGPLLEFLTVCQRTRFGSAYDAVVILLDCFISYFGRETFGEKFIAFWPSDMRLAGEADRL